MRAAKINQLNKINTKINDSNEHLIWLRVNGTERQIEKEEARESSLCDKGYACAATMTEEEYYSSSFASDMCMDYETAQQ